MAAAKSNERLVGATTIAGEGWDARLEYPMPYINFKPDESAFQADQVPSTAATLFNQHL